MQHWIAGLGLVMAALGAAAHAQGPGAPPPTAAAKPGYMIVIIRETDRPKMGAYARATLPILLKYGGRMLMAGDVTGSEQLEGVPPPGAVRVFEFPSLQHAKDFYNSPEYTEAKKLRAGHAKVDVIVADAFVPDPNWAKPAQ